MISRFITDPPYIRDKEAGRLDAIGLGLLAVWLGALQIILDKGQEDDWFAAHWIRWTALLLVVSLIAFLMRELKARAPLVDLKVFRDRNFALGCLLIGLFGGVIYGVVTLLPLFYQTVLGYSAAAAGWAVSPRGIGAIAIMPVIGVLTGRIDNRWLIVTGFAVFGATSIWMGGLNLDIGPGSLFWPIVISGAGSGMVFVPLSTLSMGTLPNEQIGNASGLFNLLRNVGGGVGISMVNTLIARHQQIHRAQLAQNMTPLNPAMASTFGGLSAAMSAGAPPDVGSERAYGMLDRMLNVQSAALSYVDVFRYLAMACFICGLIVFLMKKVRARGGPALAH